MDNVSAISELESRLHNLGASPQDNGTVELIVCRPNIGERVLLQHAELDPVRGLVGDNWQTRGSKHTEDGSAHPEMQLTLMNSRVIQAIAQDRERWSLAGDQLFVDLDLSLENLPVGQRLALGTAILEVTSYPHNGCDKFTARFGHDAIRFVNSAEGRAHRRRGIYTRVIQGGVFAAGDTISKLDS